MFPAICILDFLAAHHLCLIAIGWSWYYSFHKIGNVILLINTIVKFGKIGGQVWEKIGVKFGKK